MPLTRLSLEERIRLVRLYSMYEKATHIQKAWKKEFGTDPPSRKTIAALNKKFDETGSVADLSRSGRPKSSRTEEKVALVQAALKKDPSRSIRSLSTELGVNKAAVHRIKQETEKKKSLLGAEIRRLKEKIADLHRRLDEGNKNAAPAEAEAKRQAPNSGCTAMDQYMIQKHEMFESTLIEDPSSMDLEIQHIPADQISKLEMVGVPQEQNLGKDLLNSNSCENGEQTKSAQSTEVSQDVAIVMNTLENAVGGYGHGMNTTIDGRKNFQAALGHQNLHHPNNCTHHPLGCHMCYINSVN